MSFPNRTCHLSTLLKVPKTGSMAMVVLCLTDLKPIEYLLSIVKRKMREIRPNNDDNLKAALKSNWASIIPQQSYKATFASFLHFNIL